VCDKGDGQTDTCKGVRDHDSDENGRRRGGPRPHERSAALKSDQLVSKTHPNCEAEGDERIPHDGAFAGASRTTIYPRNCSPAHRSGVGLNCCISAKFP